MTSGPPDLECEETNSNARIGGPDACEALRNSQPWIISIYQGEPKLLGCQGTLIGKNIVLTAAHCICTFKNKTTNITTVYGYDECKSLRVWKKNKMDRIHFGDHDRTKQDPGEQEIYINKFILHKNFTGTN